ncbi:NADPH:quinone oxidoreductase family protein [Wenzhouxiangella marina]|uniref:Alcohol dehydrogenase n=1 Tax=Wenzhouxiangella marina TaxID=1579979 RepID=A0A0K0XVD4_9GAMM|nr:NADPH:quinone oxidoreductase family protein [Wenzhouxiangella marina]AKS41581.1 Alcohol dehydrogenase [Wenzhouxiangella marina]MBB6086660.1 NADPH2:quinone reductase [Wenzhouxiangella marina]
MRAIQITEFCDPARIEPSELPAPGAPAKGQVRLKVDGVGVGYFDGLLIRGDYQIRPDLPFVPGSSLAGTVKAVGEGVEHLKPGMPVAAFTLHGGLAEQLILPAANCAPLPSGIDPVDAANFFISWATSLYGLREIGQTRPGETVLVLGASGSTGTTAIECAKALGARVIACASSEAKRKHCLKHGAELAIDYTAEDWREQVKAATGGRGVDLIYDPVGGELSEAALRVIAPGGRFLVVGFVTGIGRIPMNLPLLKRCSIHGVNWGGTVMADPSVVPPVIQTLAEWTLKGRIDTAPTRVFTLDQAGTAFAELFERRSSGSLVITP